MQTKNKLLIISDSPMWQKEEGVVVFEPTLREIEKLTEIFDEIIWMGFSNIAMQNANSRVDRTGKITFYLFKMQGGNSFFSKLKLILYFPLYIYIIFKYLRGVKYVHTRAPSVPAFIAILISLFDNRRKYWHKFAGNWMEENPPKSYLLQKKLLLRATKTRVTVNGYWQNSPPHVYSFENPCFTKNELAEAKKIAAGKSYTEKLNLLFTGRIENEKGVGRIIDALNLMNNEELEHIAKISFVGRGKNFIELKEKAKSLKINYEFTGTKFRNELEKIFAESHLFVFPSSASEGFPKVLAESAAFGCVQCVSAVSSVGFYFKDKQNAVVFEDYKPETIKRRLVELFHDRNLLKKYATEGVKVADLYTYERYNERIKNEIFGLD